MLFLKPYYYLINMIQLKRILIFSFIILFCIFFNSCKGIKDKIIVVTNNSTNQQKTDSLPLIPKRFLEQEINSAGYCLVRGKSNRKVVALTFDDGPTELTNDILAILNKHGAKATFFWLGKNLSNKVDIIKKTKEDGHLIVNHSWDHTNGTDIDKNVVWENQVSRTFVELNKYGIQSHYYRPPFGGITQEQINFLKSKGITTVLWSITTMDWDASQNNEEDMFNKFKDYLHNGAIILFHDYDFGKSNEKLKAIEKIIIYGKSQGYKFVTINDL